MLKSPGLVTLGHSSCVYCKTTWHTPIWCSCQMG